MAMQIPADMATELAAWNRGAGIDLEAWIGCEGNLKLAVGYSTLFWPRFVLLEGYILREGVSVEALRAWEAQPGFTKDSVEGMMNHFHLADIQSAYAPETTLDRILFLLPILREIYEAKLAWQFPDRPCEVEAVVPDDPNDLLGYQITFWQKPGPA